MIAWAVDALIGTSLLMLLVLAVRQPVANVVGADWAYALWLLPLLRLVLPPFDMAGVNLAEALPRPTIIVVPAAGDVAAASAGAPAPAQWLPMLLALWAGGVAFFAFWQQAAYSAFLLSLGHGDNGAPPRDHGGIPVIACEGVDGPVAVGMLRRRIVVPIDFTTRYSPAEQRLALDHELIHHRRGDIWWNMAALAVLGLNWFNPIAWVAFRAFRADQELACDAAVTRRTDNGARRDYARALVKSASRPGQIAACPLNSADELKRRLKMMRDHRVSGARSAGGVVAVAALAVAGLALSGPGLARERGRPQPRILVARADAAKPIISEADAAVLRERCGDRGAVLAPHGKAGSTVVCDGGKAVDDPEVRAIVARTVKRAHAQVAAAQADVPDEVEIRKAVEQARAQVAQVKVQDHLDHARRALEQARVRIAAVDIGATRMVAVHSAMAAARAHLVRAPISAEQMEKIEAALEAAGEDLEDLELSEEMEAVEAELDRELDGLDELDNDLDDEAH